MPKQITIRIPRHGILTGEARPTLEVNGCSGLECRDFSARILDALGQEFEEELKDAAFQDQEEQQRIRQKGPGG